MRSRRAGPLLLAGAALAAGDLAGLRAAAGPAPPPGLLLGAAALALLASRLPARARPDAARLRRSGLLPLAACALAGLALGLASGRTAARICLADLEARARVAVAGTVVHRVAAGAAAGPGARADDRAPSRRLRLRAVEIRHGARACSVPGLLARVAPPGEGLSAGRAVRVEGRWVRFDASGPAVRSPGRYGMVRGRVVGAAGGASGVTARRPGAVEAALLRLRGRAARTLDRRVPADVAPLARALVLADRSGLDAGLARRFARAGMAHLLAISGLHVGILAGGLLWLLGRVVRRRVRYLAAAGLAGGYVLLIGAPAAALRASLLFAGWAAARHRGAPARPTELVGAAAAVALLADPLALTGAGFQLSFAGFGGLLVAGAVTRRAVDALGRRRGRPLPRRWRGAATAVGAGTGAFAATAPLAAHHFQRTAPVAVASNFVGVPLVTLALAGLAGALALPGPLAGFAGGAAAVALRVLVRAVDLVSGLPFGHGAVAPPGPVFWTAAGCLATAAVMLARGAAVGRAALPAGLAAAVALAGPVAAGPGPERSLLCQLDVGQGDAAVLRTRSGHWLAFDAGPRFGGRDAGLRRVVPFLRDRGARSVDLFVLSHPHRDHVGGAAAVLERFRVGRVLDAGNPLPDDVYAAFLDGVAEEGAGWLPARGGARYRVDEVAVTVLAPAAEGGPLWRRGPRDANEASVAVRVGVGPRFVYLNTGDAPRSQEERILARWPADSLRAVLLKAGHHGSRTSSGRRWLEATRPEVVVISAGAGNRYGHPHPEALGRLEAAGVPRVWRTDRDGDLCVEVRPDGSWRLEGEGAWRPGLPAPGSSTGPRPERSAAPPPRGS